MDFNVINELVMSIFLEYKKKKFSSFTQKDVYEEWQFLLS